MQGLTQIEAEKKLAAHGYNELPEAGSKNLFRIAVEVIKEPMFILLMACSSIYFMLGDYSEGIILMSWVLIIIFMTFYQHQKTEKALESLKKLSSPRVLVIRDNEEMRIPGREVVPEDIVVLNEGDRIPADGVLIDCLGMTVDESILTGESVPVHKNSGADDQELSGVKSGTLVVQGRGLMRVEKTGIHTDFGKIGQSLEKIESSGTRLQKEIKKLIRTLFIVGILISALVIAAFYFTRGDFITSLLNGLATAMAMLPEEFPVVMTVFLALGAWRLSKINVLTRKPIAIETLGSATVLCSDKTGTITQNKMSVQTIVDSTGEVKSIPFSKGKETNDFLTAAVLACQSNSFDPMDKAISEAYREIADKDEHPHQLIKEYPITRSFFSVSRVIAEAVEQKNVFTKGAPETILEMCSLSDQKKNELMEFVRSRAQKGERLLGVASGLIKTDNLPTEQSELTLEFLGFIGFADPVRPEVPDAIKECYSAGIRTIMITGDYPSTALAIAEKAGIQTNDKVITGTELAAIDDQTLQEEIKTTNVFARIVPEQKLRIINALKANNEVVAMTGDGVNDAPALVAADIGISMGNKGTDVAREASALVLLDDNFASIVKAIRSGRKIYDNMEKAMSFIIAVHIPIIGLTLIPALFPDIPVLIFPIHIVFLELIIDPVCTLAFESEIEEKGVMNRPPREPDSRFFGLNKIAKSSVYGTLLMLIVLAVYFLSINEGHTEGEIRAIAFSTLIIGNIFLILTTLSKTRNALKTLFEKNVVLYVILAITITILFGVLFLPVLQTIFHFENPGVSHFGLALLGAIIFLAITEMIKVTGRKKHLNEST